MFSQDDLPDEDLENIQIPDPEVPLVVKTLSKMRHRRL
jgi:hypothetical protein